METIQSIVTSRRNYVIATYDGKIFYKGGMGEAKNRSIFSCWLRDLHHYRWYYFTYVKDFRKAVEAIEKGESVQVLDKDMAMGLLAEALTQKLQKKFEENT